MNEYTTYCTKLLTTKAGWILLSLLAVPLGLSLSDLYGLGYAVASPFIVYIALVVGYPLAGLSSPTRWEWSELNGSYTVEQNRYVRLD